MGLAGHRSSVSTWWNSYRALRWAETTEDASISRKQLMLKMLHKDAREINQKWRRDHCTWLLFISSDVILEQQWGHIIQILQSKQAYFRKSYIIASNGTKYHSYMLVSATMKIQVLNFQNTTSNHYFLADFSLNWYGLREYYLSICLAWLWNTNLEKWAHLTTSGRLAPCC